MKKVISLLLAVSMIFIFSSCSEKGSGEKISYPLANSPVTLDPQFAADTAAQTVITNTFEGLVRLDENGEIIPGIAESWSTSADGLTYTFKLREGTEWYCPIILKTEFGEEFYDRFSSEKVTANDFVFACRRAVTLREGSSHAHRLFVIENAPEIYAGTMTADKLGVTAPDAYTLVIKLNTKCPDLLRRLTECEFMPCNKDFFEAMGGRYGLSNKHILCNGPFYVSSWDPETSLIIKANKYYAGEKKALPLSVSFSFDNDIPSIAKKLSSAGYLAALLPPDCELPENTSVADEKKNSVFGFCFNCSDKYLNNLSLRLALCESIDRNLFAPAGDNCTPQFGFIPESCFAGSDNYRSAAQGQTVMLPFNVKTASESWQTALTELETDRITLNILCPEWLEAAVKQQLQLWQKTMGIGLGVTVETKTADEIRSAVNSGEYQIALCGVDSDYDSAVDFLVSFSNGGIFRFDTAEYSAITERLMQVKSDSELLGGCFTAESYILNQGIFFPLYSRASRFVISDDAGDIYMPGAEGTVTFINAKRFD